MTIVKWEPFRDLMAMQDRMTRMLDDTLSRFWKREEAHGIWSPPVDVVERGKEIILNLDIPGVSQDEIEIKMEDNTLIIQGERKFVKESPEENYVQVERPYGTFRRTFAIPRLIDQQNISASYKDGVLRVVLPKGKEPYPRQVRIETS